MKTVLFTAILSLLCFSCTKQGNKNAFFADVRNQQPTNEIQGIKLDTLCLDSIESSYVGSLEIDKGRILFIDKKFCYVFLFDKEGHFIKSVLGQGSGPKELGTNSIEGYSLLSDGYFFVGSGNDCYLYNDSFSINKKYVINKGDKDQPEGYDVPWIYSLFYQNLLMKGYKNNLYYTVTSEYKGLNFIEDADGYFNNVHYLAKMNLETGKVEKMLGKYPSVYTSNSALKPVCCINFDITSAGDFIVSFEGDSLIYEYNDDFEPTKTYGYAGKNIKMPTRALNTISDFRKNYKVSRDESGYYTSLKFINETNTLFRSYKRYAEAETDGLQIYKEGVLIGDIDVPNNFQILGYIAPYYYATCGIDEEHESIKILKFKF